MASISFYVYNVKLEENTMVRVKPIYHLQVWVALQQLVGSSEGESIRCFLWHEVYGWFEMVEEPEMENKLGALLYLWW